MADRLIEFYGTECVHCRNMDNSIERLEKELNVKVTRLEVWHNEENSRLMQKIDTDCGGVPFLYNEKTKKSLCGEQSFETLKKWALGK
ncbi:hypothetical protein J4409_03120 [Candidatus Woesearchaeota archaeon]|nr:hypothetical protein [Candidatus Woesearchaeota archaeon]